MVQSDTTSCTAIRIMPIGTSSPGTSQYSSLVTELVVLPIRLVRNSLADSPIVGAIEALNDGMAADLERIASAHAALADDLTKILLDAAYFAGSMLQQDTKRGGSVFTKSFYERIAKAANDLGPHLSNSLHRHAIKAAVEELKVFVGKTAGDVYAILRKQHE